eukprot:942144-Pleurochrysis_carterae.AAC.2
MQLRCRRVVLVTQSMMAEQSLATRMQIGAGTTITPSTSAFGMALGFRTGRASSTSRIGSGRSSSSWRVISSRQAT